jgi:uncharacterized protein with von Willebrand factor type A (vWA) domain
MQSAIPDPSSARRVGGIIHTYQRYDPQNFPSPTQPPPDMVSQAMEHMLAYGDLRELSEEELARAIHLDASQIAGLGPSLEAIMEMLRERKRKILATYETKFVQKEASREFHGAADSAAPPAGMDAWFRQAAREEQLYELEKLWYRADDQRSPFARQLLQLIERLGNKYQVDELAAKYEFTGRTRMSIPKALEIKEELEEIDRLLKQLEEAAETAQLAVVDMEALAEYVDSAEVENLNQLARQLEQYLRDLAEQQGLERTAAGYNLTPKAYRLFQGQLLERIFGELQASRTGRHQGPVVGEGAVEMQRTEPYEFGDSLANMDVAGSLINTMIRSGGQLPMRMKTEDIEIHRTRNTPKCATAVLLDMSGSMRYDGMYINVKRMGLALDGLVRREYPGDWLQFIEIYTFAKARRPGEIVALMPKPVTVINPVVRLRADMSDENISEMQIPPHFTNIQHGLRLARQMLAGQDTPNRQAILITDGLPTAHFEGKELFLTYPPDHRTEEATIREGRLCQREGITINVFLLQSWWQSSEDVQFAHRLAEVTSGRVFFTAGKDLDRYVVWDYVKHRREILA